MAMAPATVATAVATMATSDKVCCGHHKFAIAISMFAMAVATVAIEIKLEKKPWLLRPEFANSMNWPTKCNFALLSKLPTNHTQISKIYTLRTKMHRFAMHLRKFVVFSEIFV